MPHHINVRKKRQYEKRLLNGQTNPIMTGFQAVIAVNNRKGDGYVRTDVPLIKEGHKVDIFKGIKYISRIIERKTYEAAYREASRWGTVISCRKIEHEFYLHKVEFIRLKPHYTFELTKNGITVNKKLEALKPEPQIEFTITVESNKKKKTGKLDK
jgi:hypothetical protein